MLLVHHCDTNQKLCMQGIKVTVLGKIGIDGNVHATVKRMGKVTCRVNLGRHRTSNSPRKLIRISGLKVGQEGKR